MIICLSYPSFTIGNLQTQRSSYSYKSNKQVGYQIPFNAFMTDLFYKFFLIVFFLKFDNYGTLGWCVLSLLVNKMNMIMV